MTRIQKISRYRPSIFQGKLEFTGGASLVAEHPFEHHAFRVILSLIGVCIALYVYFVGASVLNVIASKEASRESAKLASLVSDLEREYFALAQNVTPEEGGRLGLAPVADTSYVYRKGNSASALGTMSGNAR